MPSIIQKEFMLNKWNYLFLGGLISVLVLLSFNSYTQTCCVELEIPNVADCGSAGCTPSPWYEVGGTVYIESDCIWELCNCEVAYPSSVDGGSWFMFGSNTSIGYDITGLTVGQSYVFGVEHMAPEVTCSNNGNPLSINVSVDDQDFVINNTDSWQETIICFVATSTTAEVVFESSSGEGFAFVDQLSCAYIDSYSPCEDCCSLLATSPSFETCPGYEHELILDLQFESGDVTWTWTCDPPEGLNYLDDTSIQNPTFFYPEADNVEEQLFTYKVTYSDDNCEKETYIDIAILHTEAPIFEDLYVCETMFLEDLPSVSDNGYEGYWTGPQDFVPLAGQSAQFQFNLDGFPIINCHEDYGFELYINPGLEARFNFEDTYCEDDFTDYELPIRSINDLTGQWDAESFNPALLGVGSYTYTFTGNLSTDCIKPFVLEFEVTPIEDQYFNNLSDRICESDLPFVYPLENIDGFEGEWQFVSFDLDILQDTVITNYFIAEDPSCYNVFAHELYIEAEKYISFDVDSLLCDDSLEIVLDSLSNENFLGYWTPDTISASMFTGDSIIAHWVALDDGLCIDTFFHTVYRSQPYQYAFSIPDTFCIGQDFSLLDINTAAQITGVWNVQNINQLSTSGYQSLIFIPDSLPCAANFEKTVFIENRHTLEFSLPEYLCFDDDNYVLPTMSNNGYAGTWNISEINVSSSIGSAINLNFEPSNACAASYSWTLEVISASDLQLEKEDPSQCGSDDGSISVIGDAMLYEFSIDNGQSWRTDPVFDSLSFGTYVVLYRHRLYTECIESMTIELTDVTLPIISNIQIQNDNSCISDDGQLLIQQESNEVLEFSIDDGINWQSDSLFTGLGAGDYKILIRPVLAPSCLLQMTAAILGPDTPEIINIDQTEVSDCGISDGSIIIHADGTDLEYSIDGGDSFQISNVFENLSVGIIEVIVRDLNAPDCVDRLFVDIESPSTPDLSIINLVHPSACVENNGLIEVGSNFSDVEYSIDGINWQLSGLFDNLSEGSYLVRVRDADRRSCEQETNYNLANTPEVLTNIDGTVTNAMGCNEANGRIEMVYNGSLDLEYSIDNGLSYQSNTVFNNLIEGSYTILARSKGDNNCNTTLDFNVFEEACNCDAYILNYNLTNVDCDNDPLGSITISPYADETILWDDGSTDFQRVDLIEGEYAFMITYENGECQYEDMLYVGQIDEISLNPEIQPSDCTASANGVIKALNTSGGTPPYQYALDGGNYQATPGFSDLAPGNYTLSVIDEGLCETTFDFEIEVLQDLEINLPVSLIIDEGDVVTLDPMIDAADLDNYSWTPLDYIVNQNDLIIDVQPPVDIQYELMINWGVCSDNHIVDIEVIPSQNQSNAPNSTLELYMPNVLLPDVTGNNTLYAQGKQQGEFKNLSLTVYDYLGVHVYEAHNMNINDPSQGWRPANKGKKSHQAPGIFIYKWTYELNGETKTQSGTLTVIY